MDSCVALECGGRSIAITKHRFPALASRSDIIAAMSFCANAAWLVLSLTAAGVAQPEVSGQGPSTNLGGRSLDTSDVFVPHVSADGTVMLPIADGQDSTKISPIWTLSGDSWIRRPDQIADTPLSGVMGITAPVLAANGRGIATAISKFFVPTADMKILRFGLTGSGTIGSSYVTLEVDGKTMNRVGPESPNKLIVVNWDLTKYTGRATRIRVHLDGGWMALAKPPDEKKSAGVNYHLSRRFAQRVSASLTTSVYSAETRDGILKVYAPVPPELSTQSLKQMTLTCLEYPSLASTRTRDTVNPTQEYLCLTIPISPNTFSTNCTVRMAYVADLYSVQLASGAATPILEAVDISDTYRSQTTLADYNDPRFQSWLDESGLRKRPNETDFGFGARAFSYIGYHKSKGKFVPFDKMKASLLCDSAGGDCGALSVLFCSVLRANGVAATTYPGRWALNEEGDYGQYHVNAAIAQPGVGWVPVDMLFGVGTRQDDHKDPMSWFGKSEGRLIAFSSCMENRPEKGLVTPLGQYMTWSYQGKSVWAPKWEDHWQSNTIR